MERIIKKYNENLGTYEYIDAFSGAGIFDTIIKGITSKFAKDTAKTLGTKALEAGVNKIGSEIGTRAANKVISTVDGRFSKPPKSHDPPKVDSGDKSSKPLGNVIIKELNKTDKLTSPENLNAALKKQYYGGSNKQFQSKLNKLLK